MDDEIKRLKALLARQECEFQSVAFSAHYDLILLVERLYFLEHFREGDGEVEREHLQEVYAAFTKSYADMMTADAAVRETRKDLDAAWAELLKDS